MPPAQFGPLPQAQKRAARANGLGMCIPWSYMPAATPEKKLIFVEFDVGHRSKSGGRTDHMFDILWSSTEEAPTAA
jgi:hypothetical protein